MIFKEVCEGLGIIGNSWDSVIILCVLIYFAYQVLLTIIERDNDFIIELEEEEDKE